MLSEGIYRIRYIGPSHVLCSGMHADPMEVVIDYKDGLKE